MRRRFVLVAVVLAVATVAVADSNATLRQALAAFDDHLTTGRLVDRAVPFAGLAGHDGTTTAPVATAAVWRQLAHELRLSDDDPSTWPDAEAIRDHGRADGPVAIGILDVAYEALRPDAAFDLVADTLVPHGPPAESLIRRRAVAAAALAPDLYQGRNTSFVIPVDLLIADEPLAIIADLDDGAGFRPVTPGEPFAARYATSGEKTARLRLTTNSGEVRHAAFTLRVAVLEAPEPTAVWPLTASIAHDGAAATGEAFVYLADGHADVTDPVIVVEGFDLDNSLGWPELYDLLNQENLLEDLRAAGRDAVVLNFSEATDPIQRNAFLLVELLAEVDARLAPGATYPVIGASMGGLVTRYALTWLEHQGAGHNCDLYISFDTPHAGADIPLGLQSWLDFFQGESEEAAYNLSRMNTVAAKQMLLYHYTALSGTTAAPSTERAAFTADLAAIGDWPQLPRLVSVVNGSGIGASQGFVPGAQVILWEYGSLLVDIVGNVWAVPDQQSDVIFDGLIDLIWPLPDTERTVTVTNTLPWDGAPAGYRSTFADLDATTVPYGDLVALQDNHAFIPTVSALALPGATPFFDLQAEPDLLGLTPFDAIYIPAENQGHVLVTAENRVWFLGEILDDETAAPDLAAPAALQLSGAVPNPFNPRTEIRFAVPAAGSTRLSVVDPRGRRVRTLVDAELPAGNHAVVWNGRDDRDRGVATGVYLVLLEQGGALAAQRVTLVR